MERLKIAKIRKGNPTAATTHFYSSNPNVFPLKGEFYEIKPDGKVEKMTSTEKVRRALAL